MKTLLLILIFFCTNDFYSQKYECAIEKNKVKENLVGYWHNTDSTNNNQHKCVEMREGDYFVHDGEIEKGGLEFHIHNSIRLEIIKNENSVLLKNFELTGNTISEIICLEPNRLVLRTKNKVTEYNKIF